LTIPQRDAPNGIKCLENIGVACEHNPQPTCQAGTVLHPPCRSILKATLDTDSLSASVPSGGTLWHNELPPDGLSDCA